MCVLKEHRLISLPSLPTLAQTQQPFLLLHTYVRTQKQTAFLHPCAHTHAQQQLALTYTCTYTPSAGTAHTSERTTAITYAAPHTCPYTGTACVGPHMCTYTATARARARARAHTHQELVQPTPTHAQQQQLALHHTRVHALEQVAPTQQHLALLHTWAHTHQQLALPAHAYIHSLC